MQFACLM